MPRKPSLGFERSIMLPFTATVVDSLLGHSHSRFWVRLRRGGGGGGSGSDGGGREARQTGDGANDAGRLPTEWTTSSGGRVTQRHTVYVKADTYGSGQQGLAAFSGWGAAAEDTILQEGR